MKGFALVLFFPWMALCAELNLSLPAYKDSSHLYYHELIETALQLSGHQVNISIPSVHVPQKRAEAMVKSGKLSLIWLIASDERNQDPNWVRIDMGLTNGLIGKRILLLPPSRQEQYANVRSLAEFKKFEHVGGFGKDWFDTSVWAYNQLPYIEVDGEWRRIYKMLATQQRGIDYFSRGGTEIVSESLQHPYLAVEPYLILSYQRDFNLFVSQKQSHLVPVIEKSLEQARRLGVFDELIGKYWKDDFELLNFSQRVNLELETPEQSEDA